MRKTEKRLKLQDTIEQIEKGQVDAWKLQIIYSIIQNTSEHYIHNLNGATGNVVYFHKDGHKEAVFDSDGKLVQDGINDGSYNFYDRTREPLKHFSFDTHPWIMWGNSKRDITSQQERIFGFLCDFELGLLKALESKGELDNIPTDHWDRLGQLQAISVFLLALEKSNSETIYSLFKKDLSEITQIEITNGLKELEDGLNKVYKSKYPKDGKPRLTSEEFQQDADIVRLLHLKYYGELIEKYREIKGKYPFQARSNEPVYVHVANDEQEEATKVGVDYPHTEISLKEFVEEIESGVGHEIEEYYDPQYRQDYKPNFYVYMIYQDTYYFSIHVHQPFSFSDRIDKFYYKVEISNHPDFRNSAYDPKQLFESSDFQNEIKKELQKEGFFKAREEKYIHYTKQ